MKIIAKNPTVGNNYAMIGKLSNFNPPLFERNHSKDHEDTAKSPAVSNN